MSYNLTNRQKELLRKLVNGIRNEGWGETFFNMSGISDSVLVTNGASIPIDSMKDMDILFSEGFLHFDYSDNSYTITQTALDAVKNNFVMPLDTKTTRDTNVGVLIVGNIEDSKIQGIGSADKVQKQKVNDGHKNNNLNDLKPKWEKTTGYIIAVTAIVTTFIIFLTFLYEYIFPIDTTFTPVPTTTSLNDTAVPEESLTVSPETTLVVEENIKNVIRDYFNLLSNNEIEMAWENYLTANIRQSIIENTGKQWYESYWEEKIIEIVKFGNCDFYPDETYCLIDVEVNYIINDYPTIYIDSLYLIENLEEETWLIDGFTEEEKTN